MNFLVPKKMLCLVPFLIKRENFIWPSLSIAVHALWNWFRLCLIKRHAVLFNEIFTMFVFHASMIYNYIDWYLHAFRSDIRKYILRLFVICNFFSNIGISICCAIHVRFIYDNHIWLNVWIYGMTIKMLSLVGWCKIV